MNQTETSALRNMLKQLANSVIRHYRQGPLPNIALFSSARSGSTWLAEMIAAYPGVLLVDEPCHPRNFSPHAYGLPEDWSHLLPGSQREALLRPYFQRILNGQLHVGVPRFASQHYRPYCTRALLKLLRFKDIVEWFEQEFGLQVIFLIRHPLATNISRKSCPRLPLFLTNEAYCDRFLSPAQLAMSREVLERGADLEKLVLDWSLQNYPVLSSPAIRRWCCVHYEDLVVDTASEATRVSKYLGYSDTDRMLQKSKQASMSTSQCDQSTRDFFAERALRDDSSRFLLSKWRSQLDEGAEERAFRILDAFGIDQYAIGEDLPVRRLSTPHPTSVLD